MANSSVTIYLQKIDCVSTSETGKDEVYVKYTADGGLSKRYPDKGYHSMSPTKNNPWPINLPITYKETLVIGLYDSDTLGDEFLGSHTYNAADASKNEANTVSNTNGAEYVIYTGPDPM